jgi:transposase
LDRSVLSDEQWERVAPLCAGKVGDAGRSGEDNRLFLEAVLWIARTGSPPACAGAGCGAIYPRVSGTGIRSSSASADGL